MSKRDIADIVLVWMALSFLMALLTGMGTLGTLIGMTDEASRFTDKFVAVIFQVIQIWVLLFLNYMLLFRRSLLLSVIVPDGREKEVSIPSELTVLTSYSFWIRLLGVFTFLSSSIRFIGDFAIDVAAKDVFVGGVFVPGAHWNYTTGPELVHALLAIIVVWKADWIAEKVGKFGPSSKGADATSEPAPGADTSSHQV